MRDSDEIINAEREERRKQEMKSTSSTNLIDLLVFGDHGDIRFYVSMLFLVTTLNNQSINLQTNNQNSHPLKAEAKEHVLTLKECSLLSSWLDWLFRKRGTRLFSLFASRAMADDDSEKKVQVCGY
jgi:hypothetical protein